MITFKKFFESIEPMGLIETITFKELGPVEAKIDSGNGAYNVLHGVNVKVLPDGRVSFNTVNDQILDLPIEEFIDINIGDGVIKKRPVVSFDIAVGDDYYPNKNSLLVIELKTNIKSL